MDAERVAEHFYARAGNIALIIETTGVFLLTFFPNGFVGENWFPDIDSAKAQAARNTSGFPGGIGPWMLIPPEVADLWEFGKGLLGETN
jgi:hypothetical protein